MSENKGKLFWDYMKDAKKLIPESSIPNYENYLHYLKSNDEIVNNLQHTVYVNDFTKDQFLYLSSNCVSIYGYTDKEVVQMGFSKFMELFHPLDHEILTTKIFPEASVIVQSDLIENVFNVIITFNYRFKHKNGNYITLLNEFSYLVVDDERNSLVIMGTTKDISEIHDKPEMFIKLFYIKPNGKKEKIFERYYSVEAESEDYGLTKKELEIIKFVHKGMSSKEIANMTNRSEETIKSQRKSILSKTNCQSMTEVVVLAVKNNWV